MSWEAGETTSSLYEDLRVSSLDEGVLQVDLHRPEVRNALRTQTLQELAAVLEAARRDDEVRCVLLAGSERYFAAGADVREMASKDAVAMFQEERPRYWKNIREFPKPLVAAVNGFCLGGGFELAMHADILIAGRNAQFGQPEINLGIIPGAGGTQRLVRTVGKSLAMKMVLSGEFIDAGQALTAGLAAELCEPELTLERAMALSKTIAAKAPLAVALAKESVLQSYEMPLEQGLNAERRAFVFLAATADRNEGVQAFLEKRPARFRGQ